jgi:DNA-binding CsgD family transcriptional regulator
MSKFNPEWIPNILKMIEDGYLKREIAEHYGISKSTFEYQSRKYGLHEIKTKDRRFKRVPIAEIEKMYYEENKSLVEIGNLLNFSEFTVRSQLRKHSNGTIKDNEKLKMTLDECKVMYEKGYSLTDVSESSGYAVNTLKRKLLKLGVSIRNCLDSQLNVAYENHKGKHYFRSSWEANTAKYLDSHNLDWLYEPTTFNLGDCKYTPDFIVYDSEGNIEHVIEVKGQFNDYCIRKMRLFMILYPDFNYEVWDQKTIRTIQKGVA